MKWLSFVIQLFLQPYVLLIFLEKKKSTSQPVPSLNYHGLAMSQVHLKGTFPLTQCGFFETISKS